jgi:hypothetical protein
MKVKHLLVVLLFLIVFLLIAIRLNIISLNITGSETKSSKWVTINYGKIVNNSILTHSGETVGDIIQKLSASNDNQLKGLVQQYLEPYSILCHDVLLYNIYPDKIPLINIITHYPIGSERPAWVDLFREGHFQLYYNRNLIRLFLKGDNPEKSFLKYQSVVRLPILDLINSANLSIKNIEVYVFNNDYSTTTIKFNTTPTIYTVDNIDLSPHKKLIDLASIEHFLNYGTALEAIEVDNQNNVFFYGKSLSKQTLADHILSLSDIAVAYRSIFHCYYNTPYISLDQHKDNRYSKVNFGGYLDNTRLGYVVLEADKLFKTLVTGIDPNTNKVVKNEIKEYVPDFLTEDERLLMYKVDDESRETRYWFYPDEITTVTNGNIGVINNYQFFADAERMDVDIVLDKSTRYTIDHLNRYYKQYEKALETYRELNTVGRIMGLINWLKQMNIKNKVKLDVLLAVKIPAFSTPGKIKKMLAVTAKASSGEINENRDYHTEAKENTSDLTDDELRYLFDLKEIKPEERKSNPPTTYILSNLLDKHPPSTSDKEFLNLANDYFMKMDISNLYLPYDNLKKEIDDYNQRLNTNKKDIEELDNRIKEKDKTLNQYSTEKVNQYNKLIDEYNHLLDNREVLINIYNQKTEEWNKIFVSSSISIGGGIELSPDQFGKTVVNKESSIIQEIVNIKDKLKSVDVISKAGNWIRSNPTGNVKEKINKLIVPIWSFSESEKDINVSYSYNSKYGDSKTVSFSRDLNYGEYTININKHNTVLKYTKSQKWIDVKHSIFPEKYRGEVSSNGGYINFKKVI